MQQTRSSTLAAKLLSGLGLALAGSSLALPDCEGVGERGRLPPLCNPLSAPGAHYRPRLAWGVVRGRLGLGCEAEAVVGGITVCPAIYAVHYACTLHVAI